MNEQERKMLEAISNELEKMAATQRKIHEAIFSLQECLSNNVASVSRITATIKERVKGAQNK